VGLFEDIHQDELRSAGWHSRGYLPHFDGAAKPQFITVHLADSIPKKVIERWKNELRLLSYDQERILLQRRIEKYLDLGYGTSSLKEVSIAKMVQDSLLKFDGSRYHLFAWVVMPNHVHSLMTRFENIRLEDIFHSFKSFTAHEANKILHRSGQFWMEEYFDRHIRNEKHFAATVRYIEENPVRAKLCKKAADWLFSSAWFKAKTKEPSPISIVFVNHFKAVRASRSVRAGRPRSQYSIYASPTD
jgi:REP element-mobilizing transposase RayT